jgi:hypothetical protein
VKHRELIGAVLAWAISMILGAVMLLAISGVLEEPRSTLEKPRK